MKRTLALILVLIMALAILPGAALATEGEDTPSVPVAEGGTQSTGGEGGAAPTGTLLTSVSDNDVAKIGDVGYSTLAEAVAAVKDNTETTITLLKNVELNSPITIEANKNIIIDGDGKTLTFSNDYMGEVKTMFYVKSTGILTLKNAILDGEEKDLQKTQIIYSNGTLTIDKCEIKSFHGTLLIKCEQSKGAVIKDTKIHDNKLKANGNTTDGVNRSCLLWMQGTETTLIGVEITDNTVSGDMGILIYARNSGTNMNLENVTVTGNSADSHIFATYSTLNSNRYEFKGCCFKDNTSGNFFVVGTFNFDANTHIESDIVINNDSQNNVCTLTNNGTIVGNISEAEWAVAKRGIPIYTGTGTHTGTKTDMKPGVPGTYEYTIPMTEDEFNKLVEFQLGSNYTGKKIEKNTYEVVRSRWWLKNPIEDLSKNRIVKQKGIVKSEDSSGRYCVSSDGKNITVDYTATMDMRKLYGDDMVKNLIKERDAQDAWGLLNAYKTLISEQTRVYLTFNFSNYIDFSNYNLDRLVLTSDMFEKIDAKKSGNTITVTCGWKNELPEKDLNPMITLTGAALPVKENWDGKSEITITNSGHVSGVVKFNVVSTLDPTTTPTTNATTSPAPENIPSLTDPLPIIGESKSDIFKLYYTTGSGGHSHYTPVPTPVPFIVLPPKTGDMTIWQSILGRLGLA